MKAAHRSVRGSRQLLLDQPAQVTEPRVGPRPQKRVQINRQLRSFFLRGHLTPLSRTLVSTRESIHFRVPPSSQCFQGGKPVFLRIAPYERCPSSTDADSTKLQRSARPGFTAGWIMRVGREVVGRWKGEVVEEWGDGGCG